MVLAPMRNSCVEAKKAPATRAPIMTMANTATGSAKPLRREIMRDMRRVSWRRTSNAVAHGNRHGERILVLAIADVRHVEVVQALRTSDDIDARHETRIGGGDAGGIEVGEAETARAPGAGVRPVGTAHRLTSGAGVAGT